MGNMFADAFPPTDEGGRAALLDEAGRRREEQNLTKFGQASERRGVNETGSSPPTPPTSAIDTDSRSWGERHSLGAKPGGARPGGNRFGASAGPDETGGRPDITPNDPRSWGERHSLGAKPGGNTMGGALYGGNRFGASAGPGETGGQPEIGVTEADQQREARDARNPNPSRRNWVPPGTMPNPPPPEDTPPPVAGPRLEGAVPGAPEQGPPPDFSPMGPNRPGVTPPSKGGGGGGGGAGAGRGRKPLGDQTRTEAYDPTLDRKDPRNVAIVDENYRVNPKQWERAQKGAIDPTAPGERTGEKAQAYTNNYTSSLAGATKYMEDMFHQKKGDPAQAEGYTAMTFKNVGAPDPKIVNDVFKVVDPNNELAPKEKMELATRAMHDWYVSKGDQKSADKVAAEILQHGNVQAKAHGNKVMEAMKAGNREAAVQEIKAAYDWLPDGFHADVAQGKLTITNDQGKTVSTIPLDDKMIANLGVGLSTGTLYWDIVQQRAGKPGTFAPPQAQPTQAIAAQAPQSGPQAGPPGGAPAPGAPPGRTPVAGSPQAAPSAAPSPAPPPGVSAPPASGTPQPPPAAVPAPVSGPPSVPPQVTPPGNRPPAPAPAAPGPTTTPQAAPTQTQGVTPQVAPQLQPAPGPGKPSENTYQYPPVPTQQAAPPPAASPPANVDKGSGGPPGSPAKAEPAKAEPAKTGTTGQPDIPGSPPPVKLPEERKDPRQWNKDDPDTVPKINGKEFTYRRHRTDLTPDVVEAAKELRAIDKKYKEDKAGLAGRAGLSVSREYKAEIAQYDEALDKKYAVDKKRAEEVVKAFNDKVKDDIKTEREDLKADRLKEGSQSRATVRSEINEKLGKIAKDKTFKYAETSPLRFYKDEASWKPISDTIMEVHANNARIPIDQTIDLVLTAMSHVEKEKHGSERYNKGEHHNASRFQVEGKDLNDNVVIRLGSGNSERFLHMPPETLAEIKRIKVESYRKAFEKLDEDKKGYEWRKGAAKTLGEVVGGGKPDTPLKPGEKPPLAARIGNWVIGDKPKAEP